MRTALRIVFNVAGLAFVALSPIGMAGCSGADDAASSDMCQCSARPDQSHRSDPGSASNSQRVADAREWFLDVARNSPPAKVTKNASETETPSKRIPGMSDEMSGKLTVAQVESVRILSTEDLLLFADAGPEIVPFLMMFIHRQENSGYVFHYPLSSGISLRPMRLGKMACLLTEVALRRNPYFTVTGDLVYPASDAWDTDQLSLNAMEQAARAYEAWFQRCYDESSSCYICQENDFPDVSWEYYEDAWDNLKRVSERWQ